jgi:hypothetical protein
MRANAYTQEVYVTESAHKARQLARLLKERLIRAASRRVRYVGARRIATPCMSRSGITPLLSG